MLHETYIASVAAILAQRLGPEERAKVAEIKLAYGAGPAGTRGVTYYGRWAKGAQAPAAPFVEICAFGQESPLQVAGTVAHELGHVLAGWGAGHGPDWHKACERLGLRRILAGGTRYLLAHFAPDVRAAIAAIPAPTEGQPVATLGQPGGAAPKPCGAGVGTRGGKSRGPGSGTRNHLYHCQCQPPVKVRHGTRTLRAHCDLCSGPFALVSN